MKNESTKQTGTQQGSKNVPASPSVPSKKQGSQTSKKELNEGTGPRKR